MEIEESKDTVGMEEVLGAAASILLNSDTTDHIHADRNSSDFDGPVHSHPGYPEHDHG